MPEGHTLHRLAALHTRWFGGGAVAVSSPQGRFAADARLIDGRVLERAEAFGKHLFHHYGDLAVHIHLGLYGKFHDFGVEGGAYSDHAELVGVDAEPPVVGRVRMRLIRDLGEGRLVGSDLRGPTRCEVIDAAAIAAVAARLGPDPLRADADPDRAWERISRSRVPIGQLLMDQAVIAGIGNVYRAEVLFRRGITPFLPGRELGRDEWEALWQEAADLLRVGVERGTIVTVDAEHDHGDLPRRGVDRPRNYVYQRDGLPCRVCGAEVRVAGMAGRNLFWCENCQPRRDRGAGPSTE